MGLKAQHQIYNHDFSSKLEYEKAMDKKINEVDEDLKKLKQIEGNIKSNVFNSQLNDKLVYEIEEIVQEYERTLHHLEGYKMELR